MQHDRARSAVTSTIAPNSKHSSAYEHLVDETKRRVAWPVFIKTDRSRLKKRALALFDSSPAMGFAAVAKITTGDHLHAAMSVD